MTACITVIIGKGLSYSACNCHVLPCGSSHVSYCMGFHLRLYSITVICAAIPLALASPFSSVMLLSCSFMSLCIWLQDSSMWRSIGLLCLMSGKISLNHRMKVSLMARVKGWPTGPYAIHSAEYLHLPLPKPAAFTAAAFIC